MSDVTDENGYAAEVPPVGNAGDSSGPREVPGHPGLVAGDFVNGQGGLGVRRLTDSPTPLGLSPDESPFFQKVAMRDPSPSPGGPGPTQMATRAVNGVPLAIYQPQPSQTGARGVGDIDGLTQSLSKLSSTALERLSNGNIAFIAVPDSTDQAFPNSHLLTQHPPGWHANQDWGDAPGGYVDFSHPDERSWQGLLSATDPWRAVVTGGASRTPSYNVDLHETGHAWNAVNGRGAVLASQGPDFFAAYSADRPLMKTADEAKKANDPSNSDAYYLQDGIDRYGNHIGAKESYAESFARYVAGDDTLKQDWPSMYTYWQDRDRKLGLRALR